MKRLICLLFSVCVLWTIPFARSTRSANAQSASYALILPSCTLYADEACSAAVCTLPETYFVTVLQTTESSHLVGFCDLTGYVPLSSVTVVAYTPKSIYPDLPRVQVTNDGNSVTLRSAPSHSEKNELDRLINGTEVIFYGKAVGSAQIPALGNDWYYVKVNGQTQGYVYSLYLQEPVFPPNDTSPLPDSTPQISTDLTLSENGKTVLILSLCLPVFIVVWMLVKNGKKSRTPASD